MRALQHRERGHDSRIVDGQLGAQRVDARGFEPQLRPRGKLAPARGFELGEQVGELGVAPGVLLKVLADAGEEGVLPDPRDELLEHAAALGVGDAVEVDLHVFEVVDGRDDRVGRGQLVLAVGPALLHGLKGGPGFVPLGGFGGGNRRGPLGERLVEPQVVPPLHRDEVAEPHVGELVQDRDDAALFHGVGDLAAEDIDLGEGHRTRVFHSARVELGHKQLVVFLKGVGKAEL